ncbi:MAG: hypothetical protein IMHGJWDQ_000827 [Candidatus Fervidibacter sp.]
MFLLARMPAKILARNFPAANFLQVMSREPLSKGFGATMLRP